MPVFSRRELFRKTASNAAAVGLLSSAGLNLRANPLGFPIGSQTYPHRQRIVDGDFAGLCKDMAGIGVQVLELCSPGYKEFASLADAKQARKIIEDAGLKAVSAHFTMNELRNDQSKAIDWAKEMGLIQMGTASLGGRVTNGEVTMDAVKQSADEYSKIGQNAAKAGLVQFLHDEGFEMAKADGRLVYEILFEIMDPKAVKYQFQMSAMRVVGDPVMWFTKYPDRFQSIHLQGVDVNAPPPAPRPPAPPPPPPGAEGQAAAGRGRGGRGGRGPGMPQLAVGKDTVDWPKVFAAAKGTTVKNYFVEQNWDLTVQSVAYLKTLS